jgi:hypothetical protein
LITCLSFLFVSFLFLFSLNWLRVCVINALIKGEIEDQSVRGRWMVALGCDEWLTTWFGLTLGWVMRCRLRLDLRWCRSIATAKGLCLAGPSGSGETSRLDLRDPVVSGVKVRSAWWQEKHDEVVDRSRCRVAAHDRSLHAEFAAVHHKTVGLLGWGTKLRPEARQVETGSGRTEKLQSGGYTSGSQGLRRG